MLYVYSPFMVDMKGKRKPLVQFLKVHYVTGVGDSLLLLLVSNNE